MNDFLQMLWTQAWQIAVLAIIVACCTRTIAKNRPHLAHAMWLLVLVKCVTPPMWGHSLGVFSRLQTLTVSDEKTDVSTSENVNPVEAELVLSPSIGDSSESGLSIESELATLQSTQPIVRSNAADTANLITTPAPEVSDWKTAEPHRPGRDLWPGPLLFCLVVGAVSALSVMIIRCLRCLQSIHQHRTTEFDHLLNKRLQMLSKKLRLRRVPRIIVSDVLFGPAVLGVLRHTIVLPRCLLQTSRSFLPERTFANGEPARRALENAGLPEGTVCTQVAASREVLPGRQDLPKPLPGGEDLQYLDPILAHELLHIRRGDLRTGLLQAIVQSLWWFHPAVWFCNRWLSREAERCCDEQVIAELGCSPAQYARSLLSVIESKHALQPIPVFPGMKPVEITSQRMERIMSLKTGLKKQTPLWCWLAVAGLAIVVLPGAIAKPQSDEKVVEAQPEEMGLPQETKVPVVPEVEVSTKTYIVGDLIERLAKEQNLSLDQAKKSLLQIFESSVVPVHRHVQGAPAPAEILQQPLPPATTSPKVAPTARTVSSSSTEIVVLSSCTIEGDHMVVVQSAAGHATLQEYIDSVRQHGFTTFQVTARYIMGPPEEINSLMESLQREKPFPKAAEAKAVPKSQSENQSPQSAATFCVGTTGVISKEEARKIEELARLKADCLSVRCPTVSAIDGQVATIQTGETKPFIVGFKENDEPMIRTVVEGLTLLVIPKVVDKGLIQLKSAACLEGTSEQRLIATTGRVTETPKMFTLPAITTKRLQTTVELQENQAFLQSGMITTEEGKSQAFLTVLEAQVTIPEVVAKADEVDYSISVGLNPLADGRRELPDTSAEISGDDRFIVLTYNVTDLVVPVGGSDADMDFSPLIELIKTSIEPESWDAGRVIIAPDKESISLVIRQTKNAHEAIAKLILQLRKSYDSVKISCGVIKLSNDSQLRDLEQRCSLHALHGGQRWALLTKSRSEELQKFLMDEKVDLLSCPAIVTISGQPAVIEVGFDSEAAANGFRLSANPHLIADSNVIRLNHSVQIGEIKADFKVASHESLVGSGQTLVLLIEQPGKADVTPDRYVVLLTPEHLTEEKVEATQPSEK